MAPSATSIVPGLPGSLTEPVIVSGLPDVTISVPSRTVAEADRLHVTVDRGHLHLDGKRVADTDRPGGDRRGHRDLERGVRRLTRSVPGAADAVRVGPCARPFVAADRPLDVGGVAPVANPHRERRPVHCPDHRERACVRTRERARRRVERRDRGRVGEVLAVAPAARAVRERGAPVADRRNGERAGVMCGLPGRGERSNRRPRAGEARDDEHSDCRSQ